MVHGRDVQIEDSWTWTVLEESKQLQEQLKQPVRWHIRIQYFGLEGLKGGIKVSQFWGWWEGW